MHLWHSSSTSKDTSFRLYIPFFTSFAIHCGVEKTISAFCQSSFLLSAGVFPVNNSIWANNSGRFFLNEFKCCSARGLVGAKKTILSPGCSICLFISLCCDIGHTIECPTSKRSWLRYRCDIGLGWCWGRSCGQCVLALANTHQSMKILWSAIEAEMVWWSLRTPSMRGEPLHAGLTHRWPAWRVW